MEQRYNGNCEEYDGRQYSRGGLVKTQVSSIKFAKMLRLFPMYSVCDSIIHLLVLNTQWTDFNFKKFIFKIGMYQKKDNLWRNPNIFIKLFIRLMGKIYVLYPLKF